MLVIRQNIYLFCFFIFFGLNGKDGFLSFKVAGSLFYYTQISESRRRKLYPDLFDFENIAALSGLIISAVLTILVGVFLFWFIDNLGLRKELMSREARRIRKLVRAEIKHLENQKLMVEALGHERRAKQQALEMISDLKAMTLDMEEVILRYQHTSIALNPEIKKRAKLSKEDKTFRDLFDFDAAGRGDSSKAQKQKGRVIKFKPKF